MIVTTRYRDIPWEEAIKCYHPTIRTKFDPTVWETSFRGQPVQIETPAGIRNVALWNCNGPVYKVVGVIAAVCPHLAEIGD